MHFSNSLRSVATLLLALVAAGAHAAPVSSQSDVAGQHELMRRAPESSNGYGSRLHGEPVPGQPPTGQLIPITRRQEASQGAPPRKDDGSGDTNIGAPDPRVPGNRNDAPVAVPVIRRQASSQDNDISPLAAHPPVGKDHGDTDEGGQSAGSVANLPFPGHPR